MAKVSEKAIAEAVAHGGCEAFLRENYGTKAASRYVSLREEARVRRNASLAKANGVTDSAATSGNLKKALKALETAQNAYHKAESASGKKRATMIAAADTAYRNAKVRAGILAARG